MSGGKATAFMASSVVKRPPLAHRHTRPSTLLPTVVRFQGGNIAIRLIGADDCDLCLVPIRHEFVGVDGHFGGMLHINVVALYVPSPVSNREEIISSLVPPSPPCISHRKTR